MCEYIVSRWLAVNDPEERSVVIYGLRSLVAKVIHFLTTMAVGLWADRVFEVLIFYIFYATLREYGGGYHAKSSLKCLVNSLAVVLFMLLAWWFITNYLLVYVTLIALAFLAMGALVVWFLSPVDALEKPLDAYERLAYRRKARRLLLFEIGAVVALVLIGQPSLALAAATAVITVAYLQLHCCFC